MAPVLFPPGFAGVRHLHGDTERAEEASWEEWIEEVGEAMIDEAEARDGVEEHSLEGDRPPDLSPEELEKVDLVSDIVELTRLEKMGVLRRVLPDEDVSQHSFLTTKVVRDWRKRPGWTRRSRLVAREYRTWTAWSQELFAPASTLATINSLIALAISEDLEVVSMDIKDAYLNVKQKTPVIIHVDGRLMGQATPEPVAFVLERMLPGQRAAACRRVVLVHEGAEDSSRSPRSLCRLSLRVGPC